jgi:hypothetical protein
MSGTTILDLPTELLQQTFEYIDWDRSQHLTPIRPNIINISFTCRHLRKAVVPILFRNVSLKLRWVNGALGEPGLLRLRQQCPELLKHTKCVYVDTLFGHFRDPRSSTRSFGVPKELQQWLDSITSLPHSINVSQSTYKPDRDAAEMSQSLFQTTQCKELLQNAPDDVLSRFQNMAYALVKEILEMPRAYGSALSAVLPDISALISDGNSFDDEDREALTITNRESKRRIQNRNLRFKVDAFFVLLLSFPSRLNFLVFESLPTDRMDNLQNQFALQFVALAFQIYGGQLKELTMSTAPAWNSQPLPNGRPHNQSIILRDALAKLGAIQHLRLTARGGPHNRRSPLVSLTHWHALADRITHLDLRNAEGDPNTFVSFIERFANLQQLTLGDIYLWSQRPIPVPGPGPQARLSPAAEWLSFLIELRRKVPHVEFNIHEWELGTKTSLSESGVRWLLKEAVPKGATVDFERESRLMEDFESFFFLWSAEDSDRGQAAREARKDGKLVDMAMSSRWRGLFGGGRH